MPYTLFDISLAVARIVIPDMLVDGEVTSATTTSITDTNNLIQQNELYNKGTCWITSGTHKGKYFIITSHFGNKINFSTLSPAPSVGDAFVLLPRVYPINTIRAKIQQALDDTFVENENSATLGDGATLEFSLPTGVQNINKVRIQHPTLSTDFYYSNHWREKNGKLRFDYGYAPEDDWKVVMIYQDIHAQLTTYASAINNEVDGNWLKYKAAQYLLDYGMGKYGGQKEYRIEERMNFVMERLKKLSPRSDTNIILNTAG